jgi:hypothetical protein
MQSGKYCLILIVCAILFGVPIVQASSSIQAGGNFTLGFPQGEFHDNVDNLGYGFTLFGFYRTTGSFLNVGLAFNYLIYGNETREEPWSKAIPDVFVDVTTTNSILYGHLMLRITPHSGVVRPYIDGLFGFGSFTTSTKVKNQEYDDDDDQTIASTTHLRDSAVNYGFGGGLLIRVFDASGEKEEELEAVSIQLGVRYLKGGVAKYMKKGSIEIDDNSNLHYDILESETGIITFHIGVVLDFTFPIPQ